MTWIKGHISYNNLFNKISKKDNKIKMLFKIQT
jgi:hypothetical protein